MIRMPRIFFVLAIAFIVFLAGAQPAHAQLFGGTLIKVTRDTPVFENPSKQSKVLADVSKDTMLVLRDVSPKKTWLLLIDEDGVAGWVPSNRTDYASLNTAQNAQAAEANAAASEPEEKGPFLKEDEELAKQQDKMLSELNPAKFLLGIGALRPITHNSTLGPSLRFGRFKSRPNSGAFGFGIGLHRFTDSTKQTRTEVPFGVESLSPLGFLSISHGFGLGLQYTHGGNVSPVGLVVGYSIGIADLEGGPVALLRLSALFSNSIESRVECHLGWVL